MKFNINVTEQEYIKFNIFFNFHSSVGKRALLFGRLTLPAVAALAVFILCVAGSDRSFILTEALVLLIVSIIWIVGYPGIFKRQLTKNFQRMKKDGKLPYHEKETIEFLDSEVVAVSEDEEMHKKYADIEKVWVTGEFIMITIDSMRAFILPVRCLDNRKEELLDFLKTKVEDRIEYVDWKF